MQTHLAALPPSLPRRPARCRHAQPSDDDGQAARWAAEGGAVCAAWAADARSRLCRVPRVLRALLALASSLLLHGCPSPPLRRTLAAAAGMMAAGMRPGMVPGMGVGAGGGGGSADAVKPEPGGGARGDRSPPRDGPGRDHYADNRWAERERGDAPERRRYDGPPGRGGPAFGPPPGFGREGPPPFGFRDVPPPRGGYGDRGDGPPPGFDRAWAGRGGYDREGPPPRCAAAASHVMGQLVHPALQAWRLLARRRPASTHGSRARGAPRLPPPFPCRDYGPPPRGYERERERGGYGGRPPRERSAPWEGGRERERTPAEERPDLLRMTHEEYVERFRQLKSVQVGRGGRRRLVPAVSCSVLRKRAGGGAREGAPAPARPHPRLPLPVPTCRPAARAAPPATTTSSL